MNLPQRDVAADHRVDLLTNPPGFRGIRRISANGGLQIGHQQSRADSFTDHVANCEAESILAKAENVVIVATHREGRLPCPRNPVPANLGDLFREQTRLNLTRLLKLLFLKPQTRAPGLNSVLQLDGAMF